MKLLLEAGVHFGHQTRRWDPRMRPFIFTERNGIHIIDLQQTVAKLNDAYNFVRDQAAAGKTLLFVGTKKQAQEAIEAEANPANDDAIRAVKLLSSKVADAVIEGQQMREAQMVESAEEGAEEGEAPEAEVGAVDVSDIYPAAETQEPAEEQAAPL